jgi:hypothetical protein
MKKTNESAETPWSTLTEIKVMFTESRVEYELSRKELGEKFARSMKELQEAIMKTNKQIGGKLKELVATLKDDDNNVYVIARPK